VKKAEERKEADAARLHLRNMLQTHSAPPETHQRQERNNTHESTIERRRRQSKVSMGILGHPGWQDRRLTFIKALHQSLLVNERATGLLHSPFIRHPSRTSLGGVSFGHQEPRIEWQVCG
jgi:hypothetical protein